MLLYDNSGRLRLTLQLYGSIYSRTWQFFLTILFYNCILVIVASEPTIQGYFRRLFPFLENTFVAATNATLIAFSVSFRTNIAWNRFWEACQETSLMFSKWTDAYLSLLSFINSTMVLTGGKQSPNFKYLKYCRGELTHYFSVLSAVASARLVRGDIRRMEMRRAKGVAWAEQIVLRENLSDQDSTGAGDLVNMRTVPLPTNSLEDAAGKSVTCRESTKTNDDSARQKKKRQAFRMRTVTCSRLKSTYNRGMSLNFRESWEANLSVVGELSVQERKRLDNSKDRISLVLLWIIELVSMLQPKLMTPPPCLSRVYQELSNGGLGFSQAEKLSDIPFPFIFAQLLNIMLLGFTVISPLIFIVFTGVSWITPILSTLTVFNFWALNEIAKELENPFGDEANNVPVIGLHERFIEVLVEMHSSSLPSDRAFQNDDDLNSDSRWQRDTSPSSADEAPLSEESRRRPRFADERTRTFEDADQSLSLKPLVLTTPSQEACVLLESKASSENLGVNGHCKDSGRCSTGSKHDTGDIPFFTTVLEDTSAQRPPHTWVGLVPGSEVPEPPLEEPLVLHRVLDPSDEEVIAAQNFTSAKVQPEVKQCVFGF